MTGFVLDASQALAWCFEDEATTADWSVLDRLRTEFAVVPGIWSLEVANTLALAERKGRIAAAVIAEFIDQLESLDIRIDANTAARGLREILALARSEPLSAYDAAYLDLAMRQGLPLATRDETLAEVARCLGVEIVPT